MKSICYIVLSQGLSLDHNSVYADKSLMRSVKVKGHFSELRF